MKIHYTTELTGIDWQRINELIELVGWPERDLKDMVLAFEKSGYLRIAYDEDKIVGIGRSVDDGKYYGMIVDLIVDPAYQGCGIGSEMISQLRKEMDGYYNVCLTATQSKQEFYQNRGWKKSKAAFHWSQNKSNSDQ